MGFGLGFECGFRIEIGLILDFNLDLDLNVRLEFKEIKGVQSSVTHVWVFDLNLKTSARRFHV